MIAEFPDRAPVVPSDLPQGKNQESR